MSKDISLKEKTQQVANDLRDFGEKTKDQRYINYANYLMNGCKQEGLREACENLGIKL